MTIGFIILLAYTIGNDVNDIIQKDNPNWKYENILHALLDLLGLVKTEVK
jgi:hypothetical protein